MRMSMTASAFQSPKAAAKRRSVDIMLRDPEWVR